MHYVFESEALSYNGATESCQMKSAIVDLARTKRQRIHRH